MTLDRSPESVERVFAAIRKAHARHPDMRVGQIVQVALAHTDWFDLDKGCADTFYIENDKLAEATEALAKSIDELRGAP